jgi:hypothetical protein
MKMELLLANFRNEMEKLYETINFEHYCGEICEKLEKFLNENGIKCKAIWGQYSGASLSYVPNTDVWVENDEDFDEDEFWQIYYEAQEQKKSLQYAHWWIKTNDNYIGRGYISVREYGGSSYQTTQNYPARTALE